MATKEIPVIEHIQVSPIGKPALCYRLKADEGWVICMKVNEQTLYRKFVTIRFNYDISTISAVSEDDVNVDKKAFESLRSDESVC